jgi:hypothetical protein
MWRIEACVGRIPPITDGLTSDGLTSDGLTASLCRPGMNCWSPAEVLIREPNNLELLGNKND